jgi:hypothetical protein
MSYSKSQIMDMIKDRYPSCQAKIFKTDKPEDFSLTQDGYTFITTIKLYPDTFKAKLENNLMQAPSTLILLKKIFKNPYFIRGKSVYYFDEIIHAEICIHNSLESYLKHLKSIDKFNYNN